MKSKLKILFILKKRREQWGGADDGYSSCGLFSSGLFNSANFVHKMLLKNNIKSKLVEVIDNNCIDRFVKEYKPTHVIVEAIWVVPEKFEILTKLHPKVKFLIRNHSETPFLSMEGNGIDWLLKYVKYKNVYISNNSKNIQNDFKELVKNPEKVIYLPNYYETSDCVHRNYKSNILDIGCFSSIRPLKNMLIQAIAAIRFAKEHNKFLDFHINSTRIEGRGDAVLKSLRALFSHFPHHRLIEHSWQPHNEFLKLLSKMDMVLQVSMSESFNIVCADAVSMGIPIVVSSEIHWASRLNYAKTVETNDIIDRMNFVYQNRWLVLLNKILLKSNARQAESIWLDYFLGQD